MRPDMLRHAILILSGNSFASLLLFARNIVVARLIPVEDYGIAATFAIAMAVVEMASQLGLHQLIVQARNGEDPRFQAALQGFQLLRGLLSGLLLAVLAGVLADFMNIPEVAWAYQVLALIPVLNALQHFDIHRLNRSMRFRPMILTGAVPAVLSLLAIWPLAAWLGDYRVMLGALLLQAASATITSHLVAEQPYRLVLDRAITRHALSFGWPLLVNGALLFAAYQGDRVIVGRELGMLELALFSMGVTVTLTPTLIMAKSLQNLFLPQLSQETDPRSDHYAALCQAVVQATLLSGAVLVPVVQIFGPWVITAALGDRYTALVPLLGLFAVQQGIRLLKNGPNLISLALGHSIDAMLANGVRVLFLPLAWVLVVQGYGVVSLLLMGIVAELLGFALSIVLVLRRLELSLRPSWRPIALTLAMMAAATLSAVAPQAGLSRAADGAVLLLFAALSISSGLLYRHVRAPRG